jgi:hypothetical protein
VLFKENSFPLKQTRAVRGEVDPWRTIVPNFSLLGFSQIEGTCLLSHTWQPPIERRK